MGVTLLFWFAGALFTIAGTCVIIEFGLTIPRYVLDGIEQGIPKSGGTLNYVRIFELSTVVAFADHISCNMYFLPQRTVLDPSF